LAATDEAVQQDADGAAPRAPRSGALGFDHVGYVAAVNNRTGRIAAVNNRPGRIAVSSGTGKIAAVNVYAEEIQTPSASFSVWDQR
jgi:hypothetical protein